MLTGKRLLNGFLERKGWGFVSANAASVFENNEQRDMQKVMNKWLSNIQENFLRLASGSEIVILHAVRLSEVMSRSVTNSV